MVRRILDHDTVESVKTDSVQTGCTEALVYSAERLLLCTYLFLPIVPLTRLTQIIMKVL